MMYCAYRLFLGDVLGCAELQVRGFSMGLKPFRLFAAFALSCLMVFSASAQGLLRDAEIESSLRRWTNPILDAAGLQPDDVQIFLLNDPSLNAFVANGQRIHLFSGLIIACEKPEELLGVIAHETAHISAGHTVTRTAAAGAAGRVSLVSIGLGVLAIAAGEGQAGAALIAGSQQFAAATFFKHTRAEEATADQLAVKYLSKVGLTSVGLSDFFENYAYQEALSEARRFEYFRSHPLSRDRIRSIRQVSEETGLLDAYADDQTQHEFAMMRAKLIGFLSTPNKVYVTYPKSDTSVPARYARAISAFRHSDINVAISEVDTLIAEQPENPYFYELKGDILFDSGRAEESVAAYETALELLDHPLIRISMARSLTARGQTGDLKRAEESLLDALIAEPNNAFAWNQLAATLDKLERRPEAQLATAESAYHIGDYQRAHSFAARSLQDLEPRTPKSIRARDIVAITDPRLEENRNRFRR